MGEARQSIYINLIKLKNTYVLKYKLFQFHTLQESMCQSECKHHQTRISINGGDKYTFQHLKSVNLYLFILVQKKKTYLHDSFGILIIRSEIIP